ncbi:hypothetical protein ISS85_02815 [Candidatus Microgenomates bacterium]|nr:hypothetical protein [Candidatus Microgenomates bacterium]
MKEEKYPYVKDVLKLLGMGAFLGATLVMPGLIKLTPSLFGKKKSKKRRLKEWEKFNLPRLRQTIKRLYEQKMVKVVETRDGSIVKLTEKGELKALRFKFEGMVIGKPKRWDKKWRLIIYDIPKSKKTAQGAFRRMLKEMKFLQLQKSVYLCPFPCEQEIKFLREVYGIGRDVLILTVEKIENDQVYRKYFGV